MAALIIESSEIKGNQNILGYEPFFNKNVTIGTVDHTNKEVRPSHGYFPPHSHGKRIQRYARIIGYKFNVR